MALNKLKFNSINVTPSANKALKFNSSADGFETGSAGGAMTFISKQTASSSSTISFTSGIDSTYKEYVFHYADIHPATDGAFFGFQTDTGTNTNYNQTVTSTFGYAAHNEGGSATVLTYLTGGDQAQGTGLQYLSEEIGNGNDESCSGILRLFNPSSSTFVKHFINNCSVYQRTDYALQAFVAGYINTTTALTRAQFKMSSGNIDSGTITLYGIN